ncbi:MAG: NuoI/complex I 23 kDa subunit family protein [Actinomycetota bacterium]
MATELRTRPEPAARTPSDADLPKLGTGTRGLLLGAAGGIVVGTGTGLLATLWLKAALAVFVGFVVGSMVLFGAYLLVAGIPGVAKGLMVTMKHLLSPSITQRYPEEKPDLPARTRGVIALKEANCTVCYKCSRECPDWCIYIDAHKETHEPASGGRARSVKVLDRFAIDYALCMYCGICVEACPFDALFWSPEFEYAEFDIREMTHEKERLEEWTYFVKPPPELEEGAEAPADAPAPAPAPALQAQPPLVGQEAAPQPTAAVRPAPPAAPPAATGAAPPTTPPVPDEPTPEQATPSVAAGGEQAVAPTTEGPRTERVEVELDQPTFDRVLEEELAKGTQRRVAEGKARRAAMIEARKKAQES